MYVDAYMLVILNCLYSECSVSYSGMLYDIMTMKLHVADWT